MVDESLYPTRRAMLRGIGGAAGVASFVTLNGTARAQSTEDLRSISYGETRQGEIDESDPTGYRGHYEPVTFEGASGDVVTIRMNGEGDTYLKLEGPNGNIVAENDDDGDYADFLDSRIHEHTLEADGEYTIIATSYDEAATFTYDLGLDRVDSGDDGNDTPTPSDGRDLRSISYGETRQGEIDESDPTGYRGHYEPVTFEGTSGDVVTIRMNGEGDTYLKLEGPSGNIVAENDDDASYADYLDSRIQTVTLPSTGEYTIIATSYVDTATFTYDLGLDRSNAGGGGSGGSDSGGTGSPSSEYLSGTVVDANGNPVPSAQVEAYYRAGGQDGPDQNNVLDSGAQLISAARTDAEGQFVFDGGNRGTPLPRSEAASLRDQFAAGHGKGVTLVARSDGSMETEMTSGNVWFTGTSYSQGEFFTADFDVSLRLDCQRLFHSTAGGSNPNSRVFVFREIDPETPNRQILNIEIQGEGPVSVLTDGACSIQVPESIPVQYEDDAFGVYGTSLEETSFPFSVDVLSGMGAFQGLPVSPAVRDVGFREYTAETGEGEELRQETISGIIGFVPYVGTAQGFINTMSSIVDANENSEPQDILGSSVSYEPNSEDLVKGNWRTDGVAVNYRVPVRLSGTDRQEFAARAAWKAAVQGVWGGSVSNKLNHGFDLSSTLSEDVLPGQ